MTLLNDAGSSPPLRMRGFGHARIVDQEHRRETRSQASRRVEGAEHMVGGGHGRNMNVCRQARGNVVGNCFRPVRGPYIIERRCGDLHTGVDASLHRVPYFSVIYALHLLVWDLLSKYTIATD
jgi:hypothetical protein